MKTQTTVRVDEVIYHEAKDILSQIGLSYSQAISVFNNMIVLKKGLPFDVKIPTIDTQRAFEELENKKGRSFKTTQELFDDLDS